MAVLRSLLLLLPPLLLGSASGQDIAAPVAPVAADCTSAADCGRLGACTAGKCACFPGYTGPACATLDLLPAPLDAGLRQKPNRSNWCGTILPDDTNKSLWHMYNSDFSECGLGIWTTGSRVIHSIASNPIGPYHPTGAVAVQAEAHNPQAVKAPDGTYLLMDSYDGPDAGCPPRVNFETCKQSCSGHACICPAKMPVGVAGGPGNFTYHTSKSAGGPWEPITVQVDYPCWGLNLTPSPAFHPNGTMYIAFHCDTAMGDVVLVSAPSYRGPFSRVGTRIKAEQAKTAGGFGVKPHPEDPFFWIAENDGVISWHVVLHNNPRGVHFFSADGLEWELQQKLDAKGNPQPPHFFDEHIHQIDGSVATVQRRERPWILFNGDGSPHVLVTSMQGGAGAGNAEWWTMAQAVRTT